ncbi:DUF433 domain-containing protein [Aureimonas sp. Leaf324]|jgi:uncharacterized protein (DUF433 family)|uniref:DUF433 domain-containing protein n=1 Tax=Aureimonas sp. Leaf324 TaxID=1736336 RepID=UPI000AAD95A5|nr:DUF433 domain-containing protein [Aureimonas sp. Leaf324]
MSAENEMSEMTIDQAISCDSDILSGTPVFAGTRVPVDALIDHLIDNMSIDEFLENFPTVERWQVVTAIRFGARSLGAGASQAE